MDTALIEAAIQEAIAAGASAVHPIYPSATPPHDIDVVRTHTDVGITAKDLSAYVSELQRDPQMKRFDEMFATSPLGGEVRVLERYWQTRSLRAILRRQLRASGPISKKTARL